MDLETFNNVLYDQYAVDSIRYEMDLFRKEHNSWFSGPKFSYTSTTTSKTYVPESRGFFLENCYVNVNKTSYRDDFVQQLVDHGYIAEASAEHGVKTKLKKECSNFARYNDTKCIEKIWDIAIENKMVSCIDVVNIYIDTGDGYHNESVTLGFEADKPVVNAFKTVFNENGFYPEIESANNHQVHNLRIYLEK